MDPNAFMQAHPLTLAVVIAAMLVTPLFLFATFVFSGASKRAGMVGATATLVFGSAMGVVCLTDLPGKLGPAGAGIVGLAWIAAAAAAITWRGSLLAHPLSQRWLVGLQVWRVIGGVFLIEMSRGHVPGIFAYPAGIGDIIVGVTAAVVLWTSRHKPELPRAGVILVLTLGIADFAGAFFFGTASGEGRLFPTPYESQLLRFPTGMIPLFLVPYAVFFHALSWMMLARARPAAQTSVAASH